MSTARRPPLNYDQVAAAAEDLVARGDSPTLRNVRAELGGGSMATLQKHLAHWKASRQRVQAATPFSIDPTDVGNLGPRDFAAVVNHLVRYEAREARLLAAPDTTLKIDCADGGVDGAIRWSGGPECTIHLPSRNVIWQAKSGRLLSASELVRELEHREGTALKPFIAEHFRDGGSYVLFAGADMTPLQKAVRLKAMDAAIQRHLPSRHPVITMVSGADLAAWASEDLWARAVLIKASGREHPATLLTYEEWQDRPAWGNPYVWCPITSEIATKLVERLEMPGKVYRLDGAPGLGKTRFVLEALRPFAERGEGIVYLDACYAGADADVLKALANWKRAGISGTIVIDNCSLTLHQEIAKVVVLMRISVITIGDHQESGADATLYAFDNAAIADIINLHPLRPRFPGATSRVVEYAQGWPVMAITVLQALRDGAQHIAELHDDQLTRRLIGSPEPDSMRVLRLLSLFDHVGYRDSVSDQWEGLRARFVPDITSDRFFAITRQFQRKGVVAQIGRFWRVTPSPLAIRLAREWLDEASPDMRDRLFSNLTEPLSESLARRLSEITTPSSVCLARDLLAPNARFGLAEGVIGRANSRMFRALAEVDPQGAAATVRRTLAVLSDDEASAIDERGGRQELVFALERLAFYNNHFKDAAMALYVLARTENAQNSNNATGTLEKLFHVLGSQTEAPPEERLAVIDDILTNDDVVTDHLVARFLTAALQSQSTYVMVGAESQGGRPPLTEWKPKLWAEVFDYCRGALSRAVALANRRGSSHKLAKDIVAESIATLVRYQLWDELEEAVTSLKAAAWPKAIDRLKWSIRYQLADASESQRTRANAILESLMPKELADQVRVIVSEPAHDLELRDGHYVDVSLNNVRVFAKRCIQSGTTGEVFRILSSGVHRLAHAFGQFVAEDSPDVEPLIDQALRAYEGALSPRSDLPLVGISVALINRGKSNDRTRLLDKIAANQRLIDALPAVAAIPVADNAGARLLVNYVRNRKAKQPRPNLFIGQSFAQVDEELVRDLAVAFGARSWYASAFELLLFAGHSSKAIDDVIARLIVSSKFISTANLPDVHEWSVFEAIRRIIGSGNVLVALSIAEQMLELSLSASYAQRRRVADIWPELLMHSEVFERLKSRYAELDRRGRWNLLIGTKYVPQGSIEHQLALEALPIESLLDFACEYPDDVPWFLAENGTLADLKDDELRITPLMRLLLEHFGDREDVLRHIDANLHSFLSVGPREPYYEQRSLLVNQLPTFNQRRVAAWKEQLRASFDAERLRSRLSDEEMERGIY
jgi:hypothetical protein